MHKTAPPKPGRQSINKANLSEKIYTKIVKALRVNKSISNADVQEITGLEAAEISPYLFRLVDEGIATVSGAKRGTRYVMVP